MVRTSVNARARVNTAPGSDLAVLLDQPVHSSLRFSQPPFNCIPIPETSISLSPCGASSDSQVGWRQWGEAGQVAAAGTDWEERY